MTGIGIVLEGSWIPGIGISVTVTHFDGIYWTELRRHDVLTRAESYAGAWRAFCNFALKRYPNNIEAGLVRAENSDAAESL